MATFILVHGTFAKFAHWPALQQGLAAAVGALGHPTHFQEVRWSGKNRASAREIAAAAISSAVEDVQSTSKTEELFIIGHSHGGSAIAYFLKYYPTLAKSITGCAFLSTPFLAIRPRLHALEVFVGLSLTLMLATAITWALANRHLLGPGPFGPLELAVGMGPMYYLGILGLLIVFALVALVVHKANDVKRLTEEVERRQTADIPSGNYLFLRCSGDEAAAALSAMQFLAWLSVKVSRPFELLVRPGIRKKTAAGFWGLFLGVITSLCISIGWYNGFDFVVLTFRDLGYAIISGNVIAALILFVITFVVIIIPFVFVLYVFTAFLILSVQAVSLRAFGWTQLSTGFLIDLAIEPLPFGNHSLMHIEWDDRAFRLGGITHSWTYAHPVAIEHLGEWVRTALQSRPEIVGSSTSYAIPRPSEFPKSSR
jgi:hypothetical protein